ncbi:DUF4294 domain-containing protein [Falsiporphyromonas endometrii]|uniref:DUF4294 domain-containing protein n=1 Tax=Falsiporphyromonas endometrii TaxID=1387297 RepID=A0ABV9K746_9PORP
MRITKVIITIFVSLLVYSLSFEEMKAQGHFETPVKQDSIMMMHIENGDTIYITVLPNLIVSNKAYKPLTKEQKQILWRLIRDVRKTLPIAKSWAAQLVETYEYTQTMPNKKDREKHLKRVQDELMETYKPIMKKLTLRQGKILIKLVGRQTNQTSYDIVKAISGSWKAFWWNAYANLFGASLKEKYDPLHVPEDALIERIIHMIEDGKL